MMPSHEHFEHQADMGVRGIGRTREEAFEQAALALSAVVVPPERILARTCVRVACSASDDDLLLLDWLGQVVYQMAARRMVFGRFRVRIDGAMPGARLTGELWGEPIDLSRHEPGVEVKAATATLLRVAELADGSWLAQCVVDV
jgi:SHS2 domain-containing protein